jgi:biotin transport system substrate-specific component
MQTYTLKTQQFANRSRVMQVLSIITGSLLIAAAAQIEVPLWPVPVTLQTFAVLFIGMSLGWRLGVFAVVAYLLEGLAGLPVFAGFEAGLPVLLGPKAGYLFAFPLAAGLAGALVQYGIAKKFIGVLLVSIFSLAVILLIGMAYLSLLIGSSKAYLFGVQPFLIGELLKAVMLAVIIPTLVKRG